MSESEINSWLESKALASDNYSIEWSEYLRGLKNFHLRDSVLICQSMFAIKPNPVMDYINSHNYSSKREPGLWVTGSGTIFTKI